MYKKILSLAMAACVLFALTGCRKKKNIDQSFNEVSTEATSEQTTEQTTQESTETVLQTTVAPNDLSAFEKVPTDNNNPIDKAIENEFEVADSTQKINKASDDYYKAWKAELEEISTACRENGIAGYDQAEYNRILTKAQATYDQGLQMGGSEAIGNALFSAGSVYKKGTYYFEDMYEAHMGRKYTYIYK